MYYTKLHFIAAISIALLGFATVQMRAEVPIVQADTVFQGFGGGSVSGIVFGPTGETVIVMHDAQPVEINIKTKQILREYEKVPNATGCEYMFTVSDKGWLIAYTRSTNLNGINDFYGDVVWDIPTGKIVQSIYGVKLLAESKTGKYYSYINNGNKEFIGLYDIETFKFKDSIEFDQYWYNGKPGRTSAGFGIIPNSNKVLIGANSKLRSNLYVLDFDTKKYTEIPIPFDDNQKSSTIRSIAVSETGKYFVVTMDVVNDITAYLFYDRDFKFVFKETRKTLSEKLNNPDLYVDVWTPHFIQDDYLIVGADCYNPKLMEHYPYTEFYDINQKTATKRINFLVGCIDYNKEKIVIYNSWDCIAQLSFLTLPVENDLPSKTIQSIQYKDSSLLLNSTSNDKVEISLRDYNGGLLFSQKEAYLRSGINTIKLNIPLPNGVYFCVIKTTTDSNSYKFIVSQ